MAIEVSTDRAICPRCGLAYGKHKGFFSVSYAPLHKGIGFIPICKKCVEEIYRSYLSQCNNPKDAVRQTCRKLDIYWNEKVYDMTVSRSAQRSIMVQYIIKTNTITYSGRCYDDTLAEEGTLWNFSCQQKASQSTEDLPDNVVDEEGDADEDVDESVKLFWGPGYDVKTYVELEQRRKYWMSRYPKNIEIDIGTEALIRQICNLEIDINRLRAEGKPIDKSVNMLNTLLGSLNLKPTQRTEEAGSVLDQIPFGVGISWCEKYKPIKEPDEDLKDVDGIRHYILVWFVGHLSHMIGIKNKYSRLYEEEINRLRVEKPEFAEEDEGEMLYDIFSKNGGSNTADN